MSCIGLVFGGAAMIKKLTAQTERKKKEEGRRERTVRKMRYGKNPIARLRETK